ncbi:MAG TPA: amidohydrolase family protein [Burkholderiaceae bacterium]|jgi:predicted TIM-barrel fold metal-dependent hydrolase
MEPLLESQEPHSQLTPPTFRVPPGACDSHAHIFNPVERYPLDPKRSFNPPRASIEDYRRMLATLGLQRAVIVHSGAYGTDVSITRDALLASNGQWRGVALVDTSITVARLTELHAAGFRGVRFNFIFGHPNVWNDVETIAARIAPFGWHVQLLADARYLPELLPLIARLPVEVVIDHIGRMPTSAGIDDPGFQALLGLLRGGKTWCKLSGANRMGDPTPPYASVVPFARALVEAGGDHLVWGTDWPHVREPGAMPNDGDLLNLLPQWVPDERLRNAILADNPARLYGFPAPAPASTTS